MWFLFFGASVIGQLFDNRFPVIGSFLQRLRGSCYGCCRIYCFCWFGRCSCFFCFSRCSCCRSGCGYSTFIRKINAGRWQTVLVVACTKFQVSGNQIVTSSELNFLWEFSCAFEEFYFHFEDRVHLFDFFPYRSKFSYQLCSFYLVDVESGRSRTSFLQVGRINMPALVHRTSKNNFSLIGRKVFPFGLESYRILHLGEHGQTD